MRRYAKKRDLTEPAIVVALEKAGCEVVRLHQPVDLLVLHPLFVRLMECKTSDPNGRLYKRKKDDVQREFCERWNIPIVETAEQALRALGLIGSTS